MNSERQIKNLKLQIYSIENIYILTEIRSEVLPFAQPRIHISPMPEALVFRQTPCTYYSCSSENHMASRRRGSCGSKS